MALNRENTARIIDLLRKNPQGLSITDMVKQIGMNRNTASRYLESLLVSGQVEMRHFGMAKIYTASQRVPISAMLSISSELVMQLDSGLRIVFANEPLLGLLRVPAADLIGRNIEYSAAGPVFEEALGDFMVFLKSGVAGMEWHGTIELNKGDLFFSCHITPLVFNDGRKGVSVRLEDLTEMRHREHALQESEARLRSIISASPVGIGVVADRVILEVNTRLCQMTGYGTDELVGKSARMLYPTDDEFERAGRDYYALIARAGSGSVQTQWRRKNGTLIDVLLSSAPLDPADIKRGITFTALDITQHTRAEKALRESEERFRKLVEISPDAVILHQDGRIMYVNPAALALLGATRPGELTGRFILDVIDPGYRGIVRDNIRKDLEGEPSPRTELQMLRLDGTTVVAEGRGVRTVIDGKPAVMVTLQDITGRKQAEEKLFSSRQMLQLVLDTIPVRVFWKDRDSVYLGGNQAFALDTGYADPAELVGKTDYDSVSAAMAETYRADDREVMETGLPKLNFEERQIREDGSKAWLRTSKVPLRNATGEVMGMLGTYEDITGRKMLEDELGAAVERYKRLAECSLDALIITDLHGEVITTNNAALTLVELDDDEVIQGWSVFRFIDPESQERAKRDFAAMKPGRKPVMQTYTGITARGNRMTIEVLGHPITYKGSPAAIISVREISTRPGATEKSRKNR